MAAAGSIIGNLRILVDADTSKAQSALRKMGGSAGVAGAAIGAGIGLAIAGPVNAGVAAFTQFDDKMREVFTLMPGVSQQAMDDMRGQVRQLAVDYGQDVETVAGGLYQAISAGMDPTKAVEFMKVATQAAVAGVSDTKTAATLLASTLNAYGQDADQATEVADTFFTTVRLGVTTFPELASSMAQVSAPAAVLGIELKETTAALAAMTKQGFDTATASTDIAAVFTLLQKGTPELTKVLETAGYANGQAALEALGFQGTLEMLRETADRLGIAIPKMTGRVQAANAIFALTGDKAGLAQEVLAGYEDTADATTDAFETMEGGVGASTRHIQAFLHDLSISIGQFAAPVGALLQSMGNAVYLLPAIGGALGNAIGRMWTKAAATGAGKAAAAAAGAAAGAVYSAAAAVAGKLRMVLAAMWAAMGGGRIIAAAAAAGTKAGAAYAAAAALASKGAALAGAAWAAAGTAAGAVMGSALVAALLPVVSLALVALAAKLAIDLGQNIKAWQQELDKKVSAAATQPAEEAIANLEKLTKHMQEVQGLGRILGDTFGGEQEAGGLQNLARAIRDDYEMTADEIARAGTVLAAAAHEAGARGNKAVEQEIMDIASVVARRTPMITAAVQESAYAFGGLPWTPPDIAGPIRSEFQLATAAVAAGFGSIKQALANPPQMISKDDRLANMAKRMKKVMANIKKATEVGDPMAQRYWEKARAKQQQQIDKLKGKTVASTKQVKAAYRKAGIDVGNTWTKTKNKTVAAAKTAADKTISEAQRAKTGIEQLDLTGAGTNLMNTWASGITAGIPAAVAAATEGARQVKEVTSGNSPPPKGPLKDIDKGGRNVMEAWLGGFDPKRAAAVGARLAAAIAPQPAMGALAMAGAGGAALMAGGGTQHFHIGTLVADDKGIDQLAQRMDRRSGMKDRKRRRNFDSPYGRLGRP